MDDDDYEEETEIAAFSNGMTGTQTQQQRIPQYKIKQYAEQMRSNIRDKRYIDDTIRYEFEFQLSIDLFSLFYLFLDYHVLSVYIEGVLSNSSKPNIHLQTMQIHPRTINTAKSVIAMLRKFLISIILLRRPTSQTV